MYRESVILAKESESLVEEDSYMAQRLALMSLPSNLATPERPFAPITERALRTAYYSPNGYLGTNMPAQIDVKVMIPTRGDKDSVEHIFMSVDSIVYHVDLGLGERERLFSTNSIEFDFMPVPFNGNKYVIATFSGDTLVIWKKTGGKWSVDERFSMGELLPSRKMQGKNSLSKMLDLQNAVIVRNDSVYIIHRNKIKSRKLQEYGEWKVRQTLKGGELAWGHPDRRRLLDVLAINDNQNSCIYTYESQKDGLFACVDTLETAGLINEMSFGGSLYWYWLVAIGQGGVHVYEKNYGHNANDECWHQKHYLSEYKMISPANLIAFSRGFFTIQDNALFKYNYILGEKNGRKIK